MWSLPITLQNLLSDSWYLPDLHHHPDPWCLFDQQQVWVKLSRWHLCQFSDKRLPGLLIAMLILYILNFLYDLFIRIFSVGHFLCINLSARIGGSGKNLPVLYRKLRHLLKFHFFMFNMCWWYLSVWEQQLMHRWLRRGLICEPSHKNLHLLWGSLQNLLE